MQLDRTILRRRYTAAHPASVEFNLPTLSVASGRFDEQCDFVDGLGVLENCEAGLLIGCTKA